LESNLFCCLVNLSSCNLLHFILRRVVWMYCISLWWLLFGLPCTKYTSVVAGSLALVRKPADSMMRAETHPRPPKTADNKFIVASDGFGRLIHASLGSHVHQMPETYIVASDGSVAKSNEPPPKVENAMASHKKTHHIFEPDFVKTALVGDAHRASLATGHLGMDLLSTEMYTTTMPLMGTTRPTVLTSTVVLTSTTVLITTAGALDYQATTTLPMSVVSTTALASGPSMGTVSPYSVTALPTATAAGAAPEGSASATSRSQSWLAYILAVTIIICVVSALLSSRSKKSCSFVGRRPQQDNYSGQSDAEAWKASRKLQSSRK